MKDILVFFSDQHSWSVQGYAGNKIVRTPNLDSLVKQGTVMQNNYTVFPLCVPARMAMMSGVMPSKCKVMDNDAPLNSLYATFAHSLNSVGYETVLCGRMHFVGPDQRHGFSKRIAGDMTPIFNNRPTEAFKRERGVHLNTPQGGANCLKVVGGGNSPTLEFDRYVVSSALEYLKNDYDKPQLICVGTYAPHHPYVAPKELFDYYYELLSGDDETLDYEENPFYAKLYKNKNKEIIRAVRAAYYGMVEFMDAEIGAVYSAFEEYLKRTGHEGVFVYISDHGDHLGSRGYYGKSTLYEDSIHTPMLFVGSGIEKGKQITGATSLLDIGPTLCDIANAPISSLWQGKSLKPLLFGSNDDKERIVFAECGGEIEDSYLKYGFMAKYQNYKFVHYNGLDELDALYDISSDPQETINLINEKKELANWMRDAVLKEVESPQIIMNDILFEKENISILKACNFDSDERWHAPECARSNPSPMFSGS